METKTEAKHSTKPKNTTQNRMESTDHIGLLTVNERNIQWLTNSQLSVHIQKLVFALASDSNIQKRKRVKENERIEESELIAVNHALARLI